MYQAINNPVNYGGLELKNRIIFAPTTFGLSDEEYFEKIRKIKLAAESEGICDGSDGQIGGGQKLRCGFHFFLKDELTGRNAHAGLESG